MTEEKLEKFKKFAGSWEFQMQSENIEEVLAAQGKYIIYQSGIHASEPVDARTTWFGAVRRTKKSPKLAPYRASIN